MTGGWRTMVIVAVHGRKLHVRLRSSLPSATRGVCERRMSALWSSSSESCFRESSLVSQAFLLLDAARLLSLIAFLSREFASWQGSQRFVVEYDVRVWDLVSVTTSDEEWIYRTRTKKRVRWKMQKWCCADVYCTRNSGGFQNIFLPVTRVNLKTRCDTRTCTRVIDVCVHSYTVHIFL